MRKEQFDKKIKEHRRYEDLRKLQVKRQYLIDNCFKKEFKPTAQMIENAFVK